jgi:hypothetical protein
LKGITLIKVPPLTAVYDVPGVAALNSISTNPILLSTCQLLGQGKGGFGRSYQPGMSKTNQFVLAIICQFLKLIIKRNGFVLFLQQMFNIKRLLFYAVKIDFTKQNRFVVIYNTVNF